MMFMVTLTHTPEMCLARPEYGPEFKRWFEGMNDLAQSLNVRIHDIFSCPTEHIFYFILDVDEYENIMAFFSGIMLTNHSGRISPIVTLDEAAFLVK